MKEPSGQALPEAANLGQFLRQRREQMGLSLRQLSERVGVHFSYLGRLEQGDYEEPKVRVLQRLAYVLEIDPADLAAYTGYTLPETLPNFTPYLRAKYDLSDDALRDLSDYFDFITTKYQIRPRDKESVNAEEPTSSDATSSGTTIT
jgi:transcriptional regulator with XRE-family HTH domain